MRYSHQLGNNIMNVVQNFIEKIRPLVGLKGWDHSVVWKLSEDQRLRPKFQSARGSSFFTDRRLISYIELVDCCCAGAEERTQNGGEGRQFPVSAILPCRDVLIQHPRTKSCELLAQIPSSIPLDNGNRIHAQTLISSIPRWLNFSNNSESSILEEAVGTRVLIPVPGGLIELFVANQVSEDQQTIDFVTCQCNIFMDQDSSFSAADMNMTNEQKEQINQLQQQAPVSPSPPLENLNFPCDISLDRIRLCSSPMNYLQHLNYNEENRTKSDGIYEGMENGVLLQDMDSVSMMTNCTNMNLQYVDLENKDNQHQPGNNNDKDSVKQENGGSPESLSDCNDQMDDEDDAKYRKRTGKGQAKNLIAERKRRKKLNDRLYTLRSLVPNISKLDRASILGDAIEFVKELQRQAKELQDDLEEQHSDEEGGRNGNRNIMQQEIILSQSGLNPGSASDLHGMSNGFHVGAPGSKLNQESEITHDKGHQMEPQVEVAQLVGTEFFVRVFSEHKPGGFVKLMDAFDSLGLEVTSANVTSNRGLVSNVFNVVKKDSEMVQADYVRDSLLELTRNMPRGWPETAKPPENCSPGVDQHNHHQHGLMHNGRIVNGTHHHLHHFHD